MGANIQLRMQLSQAPGVAKLQKFSMLQIMKSSYAEEVSVTLSLRVLMAI